MRWIPLAAVICLVGSVSAVGYAKKAPSSLVAPDGVIEISQAAALEGGVTPGDEPGFPVTISLPGSYRLTSNLEQDDPAGIGIRIDSSDVTIDLNGFSVEGPTRCVGTPPFVPCKPTAFFGSGIRSKSDAVTVSNGSVRGAGDTGISLSGRGVRIERVHVSHSGGSGISIGGGSECLVRGVTSRLNGTNGIQAGASCLVVDSIAANNGGIGIVADLSSRVAGNTVSRNNLGILARGGSSVVDNTVFDNEGLGLSLDPVAGYARNVLSQNNGNDFASDTHPELSGGVAIGPNLCGSDAICP